MPCTLDNRWNLSRAYSWALRILVLHATRLCAFAKIIPPHGDVHFVCSRPSPYVTSSRVFPLHHTTSGLLFRVEGVTFWPNVVTSHPQPSCLESLGPSHPPVTSFTKLMFNFSYCSTPGPDSASVTLLFSFFCPLSYPSPPLFLSSSLLSLFPPPPSRLGLLLLSTQVPGNMSTLPGRFLWHLSSPLGWWPN